MKTRLLTAGLLVGASLMGYAQKAQKPIKTYRSPRLIDTQFQSQNPQNGKALLKEKLNLRAEDQMESVKVASDNLGFTHEKFQHYYKGVKVFGSEYSVHSKDGAVTHLTGNFAKIGDLNMKTELSESAALGKARKNIDAKEFVWDTDKSLTPKAELLILDAATTGSEARLAYKFEVIAARPFQRYDVYVDAKSGEILMQYSKIHLAQATGSGDTRYSGSQTLSTDSYSGYYRLRDYSRGSGVVTWDATTATSVNSSGVPIGSSDYTDNNNSWTASEFDNSDKDDAGLEAHFGAMATYDFFSTTFGRNSYNGSGATINSHVNTDIEAVYGYPSGYNDNAFWNGNVMVYGKGNSLDPLTTVDITGHEIGHAFMEYTANLVYQKESGAMNESFSDIWGTCVENYTNTNYGTSKDLWNLGTEIGQTFRSMSNPNAYGQPDTYGGSYWVGVTNCNPSNNNDQCGVHTNSGVGNHMFYILTVGKSGTNDNGDSYSVTGIGIDKAAAINWRAESQYLSVNSDYADWRTYAIQSAKDLYGAGSAEEIAVTNAWYAVGVGAEYQQPIGCVSAPLTLTITLDNYPEETSWTVKNSGGSTVASGGTYGSQPDGSTVTETISGLTVGDYTFTINDSYGDGICCSYGNGSYSLASGSTTIVSGGDFNSSESTNFCISGGGADTQAPTAPSSLSASNVQETTLTLSWSASSDNVGVTGYNVYQGSTNIGTVTGTTANITGLTSGTSYSFYVTAVDAASNESNASNTINVTTSSPDATAPSVPTGLSSSNVTTSSFTLSWNASSDNVGVTGYDVYQGGSFLKSVSGTSTSITGLSSSTTYSYRVAAKDAAGNVSAQSSALSVTTNSPSVSYCSTGGNNTNYEWIDKVQLGSINNTTSANGGYGDFTSLSTTLTTGSSNTIYFSAGFSSSSYSENWRVWIDYNQDGDFNDSGERVVSGTTSNGNTYSSSFTVPSSASLGSTRMRVSMVWNSTPSSCGSFSYGEVEDYTVNISNTSVITFNNADAPSAESLKDGISKASFTVFPNPTQSSIEFDAGDFKKITEVRIIDLGGREVLKAIEPAGNRVDVSGLKKGLYFFEITSEKGQHSTKFLKE
ncbi:M4 family metallopeptidase [Marinoscillum sp.]|uniref:M4 family metallopeptidase n=1 Tax=Marinoscillum sp. TaxID=2024838 RepID=UPI003BA87A44